jgi:hypothetical protein
LVQHALTLVHGPSQQPFAMDFIELFQAIELLTYLISENTFTCEPYVSFYGAAINS